MTRINISRLFIVFISLCIIQSDLFSQDRSGTFDLTNLENWTLIEGTEVENLTYRGKTALRIKPGEGERCAYLKNFEFENGTIELDIAAIPSFTGLVFRVRDDHVYEGIYFRPQNSGNPDPVRQGHTVQYISNPRYSWYYLREKYPEKYEAHAGLDLQEWFHVRIEVEEQEARIYVNQSETPCLVIDDLKHGLSSGSVGVWAGNTSAGTFANLKITPGASSGTGRSVTKKAEYSPDQEYLFDIFKNRRSVRKFKQEPVPDEHIMKILDIARTAPTSGNQQPWKFLVITDKEKLDQLRDESVNRALEAAKRRPNFDESRLEVLRSQYIENYGNYLSAPVYIVVLTDKNSRYPAYNKWDGPLAAGYLMIAARTLGYGTVFITDSFPEELTREVFGIPDNFERVCFTPIGVPEEWPVSRAKKRLSDFVVFDKLIAGVNYTVPVTRKEIEIDSALLDRYTGKYKLENGTIITVTKENSKLYAQVQGQQKLELSAEAEDKFFLKVADVQFEFTKDESGTVNEMILIQGGQRMVLKKTDSDNN
ncbi:nitroreductase family protein [candidate division KSB1 bacterium]